VQPAFNCCSLINAQNCGHVAWQSQAALGNLEILQMAKRIFGIAATAFLLILWASSADAQRICPKRNDWSCYSAIEMRHKESGEPVLASIIYYRNGEIQAEVAGTTAGKKELLVVRPYLKLYRGVPDPEITEGFAFMFFDYAFAAPVIALQAAFPNGPDSVTSPVQDKRVTADGIDAGLSVDRISPTRFSYRLVMRDPIKTTVTGYWDAAAPTPLKDDQSIADWKSCTLRTYATVGAARRADETCPIGGGSKSGK
jgi:hypothetical protein